MVKKNVQGVTAEKDEFSDWFTQIMLKADLADYTSVSGCIAFRPTSYAIWEKLVSETDTRFKKVGIQNVYFPIFIPEKNFKKLKQHTEHFDEEVAWVTHGGSTKLGEKLAVRPTSETIMYESYSKWIRSWRDLPMRYNQWNNVVRWEFKHPVPFLRTREFLWNEGHTVFATKEEAMAEGKEIIKIYDEVCKNYMALPSLIGKKSRKETFPGADYTISMEYFMPNGKAIQGPDFHHDGQHYAKAYDIKFLNKEGKSDYVWQNTFAFTTRMLGVMFAVHSDKKGLVLPPKVAPNQIVIVPILFDDTKEKVLKEALRIQKEFSELGVILDDREGQSPGFKFNEWELKGIPIRMELGPKDLEKKSVVLVRRDNCEKQVVKIADLKKVVPKILDEIQAGLLKKASKMLEESLIEVKDLGEVKDAIKNKKIALAAHCGEIDCEEDLKAKTGAKVLNIPFEQGKNLDKALCVVCGNQASYVARIGKSY